MKGDATINTLGLIFVVGLTIFLFFIFLPEIINLLWKEVSLSSPSVVSEELAGYISISGAAPHSIKTSYHPSSLYYDVEIEDRICLVTISEETGGILERTPGKGTFPIDPIGSFSEVNHFVITNSEGVYEVDASWQEKVL